MYREEVPFVDEDRELHIAINDTLSFLQNMVIESEVLFN